MLTAVRAACSLLKLRIGFAVAASALAGMAAAAGPRVGFWQALGLVVAVLGASGAAGAFNHYYERDLDRGMIRTRSRPFASGMLEPRVYWPMSFAVLLLLSIVLAVMTGGAAAAGYVLLGAFTYGFIYTVWLKRRSRWNIVIGGLAGSFAVLAGAAAVDPAPQPVPMLLALVLFLWTPPHFWSLAAAKPQDYARVGVPMLPVVAPQAVWTTAILLHSIALAAVSLLPLWYGKGVLYGVFASAGGAYFVWRSLELYRAPDEKAALANFSASLVQLGFLVLGAILDNLPGLAA